MIISPSVTSYRNHSLGNLTSSPMTVAKYCNIHQLDHLQDA
jgi:hypothetical protein